MITSSSSAGHIEQQPLSPMSPLISSSKSSPLHQLLIRKPRLIQFILLPYLDPPALSRLARSSKLAHRLVDPNAYVKDDSEGKGEWKWTSKDQVDWTKWSSTSNTVGKFSKEEVEKMSLHMERLVVTLKCDRKLYSLMKDFDGQETVAIVPLRLADLGQIYIK